MTATGDLVTDFFPDVTNAELVAAFRGYRTEDLEAIREAVPGIEQRIQDGDPELLAYAKKLRYSAMWLRMRQPLEDRVQGAAQFAGDPSAWTGKISKKVPRGDEGYFTDVSDDELLEAIEFADEAGWFKNLGVLVGVSVEVTKKNVSEGKPVRRDILVILRGIALVRRTARGGDVDLRPEMFVEIESPSSPKSGAWKRVQDAVSGGLRSITARVLGTQDASKGEVPSPDSATVSGQGNPAPTTTNYFPDVSNKELSQAIDWFFTYDQRAGIHKEIPGIDIRIEEGEPGLLGIAGNLRIAALWLRAVRPTDDRVQDAGRFSTNASAWASRSDDGVPRGEDGYFTDVSDDDLVGALEFIGKAGWFGENQDARDRVRDSSKKIRDKKPIEVHELTRYRDIAIFLRVANETGIAFEAKALKVAGLQPQHMSTWGLLQGQLYERVIRSSREFHSRRMPFDHSKAAAAGIPDVNFSTEIEAEVKLHGVSPITPTELSSLLQAAPTEPGTGHRVIEVEERKKKVRYVLLELAGELDTNFYIVRIVEGGWPEVGIIRFPESGDLLDMPAEESGQAEENLLTVARRQTFHALGDLDGKYNYFEDEKLGWVSVVKGADGWPAVLTDPTKFPLVQFLDKEFHRLEVAIEKGEARLFTPEFFNEWFGSQKTGDGIKVFTLDGVRYVVEVGTVSMVNRISPSTGKPEVAIVSADIGRKARRALFKPKSVSEGELRNALTLLQFYPIEKSRRNPRYYVVRTEEAGTGLFAVGKQSDDKWAPVVRFDDDGLGVESFYRRHKERAEMERRFDEANAAGSTHFSADLFWGWTALYRTRRRVENDRYFELGRGAEKITYLAAGAGDGLVVYRGKKGTSDIEIAIIGAEEQETKKAILETNQRRLPGVVSKLTFNPITKDHPDDEHSIVRDSRFGVFVIAMTEMRKERGVFRPRFMITKGDPRHAEMLTRHPLSSVTPYKNLMHAKLFVTDPRFESRPLVYLETEPSSPYFILVSVASSSDQSRVRILHKEKDSRLFGLVQEALSPGGTRDISYEDFERGKEESSLVHLKDHTEIGQYGDGHFYIKIRNPDDSGAAKEEYKLVLPPNPPFPDAKPAGEAERAAFVFQGTQPFTSAWFHGLDERHPNVLDFEDQLGGKRRYVFLNIESEGEECGIIFDYDGKLYFIMLEGPAVERIKSGIRAGLAAGQIDDNFLREEIRRQTKIPLEEIFKGFELGDEESGAKLTVGVQGDRIVGHATAPSQPSTDHAFFLTYEPIIPQYYDVPRRFTPDWFDALPDEHPAIFRGAQGRYVFFEAEPGGTHFALVRKVDEGRLFMSIYERSKGDNEKLYQAIKDAAGKYKGAKKVLAKQKRVLRLKTETEIDLQWAISQGSEAIMNDHPDPKQAKNLYFINVEDDHISVSKSSRSASGSMTSHVFSVPDNPFDLDPTIPPRAYSKSWFKNIPDNSPGVFFIDERKHLLLRSGTSDKYLVVTASPDGDLFFAPVAKDDKTGELYDRRNARRERFLQRILGAQRGNRNVVGVSDITDENTAYSKYSWKESSHQRIFEMEGDPAGDDALMVDFEPLTSFGPSRGGHTEEDIIHSELAGKRYRYSIYDAAIQPARDGARGLSRSDRALLKDALGRGGADDKAFSPERAEEWFKAQRKKPSSDRINPFSIQERGEDIWYVAMLPPTDLPVLTVVRRDGEKQFSVGFVSITADREIVHVLTNRNSAQKDRFFALMGVQFYPIERYSTYRDHWGAYTRELGPVTALMPQEGERSQLSFYFNIKGDRFIRFVYGPDGPPPMLPSSAEEFNADWFREYTSDITNPGVVVAGERRFVVLEGEPAPFTGLLTTRTISGKEVLTFGIIPGPIQSGALDLFRKLKETLKQPNRELSSAEIEEVRVAGESKARDLVFKWDGKEFKARFRPVKADGSVHFGEGEAVGRLVLEHNHLVISYEPKGDRVGFALPSREGLSFNLAKLPFTEEWFDKIPEDHPSVYTSVVDGDKKKFVFFDLRKYSGKNMFGVLYEGEEGLIFAIPGQTACNNFRENMAKALAIEWGVGDVISTLLADATKIPVRNLFMGAKLQIGGRGSDSKFIAKIEEDKIYLTPGEVEGPFVQASFYRLTDKPLFTPVNPEGYFYTPEWANDIPDSHPAVFYFDAAGSFFMRTIRLEADSESDQFGFLTVSEKELILGMQPTDSGDFEETIRRIEAAGGKGEKGALDSTGLSISPTVTIRLAGVDLIKGAVVKNEEGRAENAHVQGVGDQLIVTLNPGRKNEQRFSFHLPPLAPLPGATFTDEWFDDLSDDHPNVHTAVVDGEKRRFVFFDLRKTGGESFGVLYEQDGELTFAIPGDEDCRKFKESMRKALAIEWGVGELVSSLLSESTKASVKDLFKGVAVSGAFLASDVAAKVKIVGDRIIVGVDEAEETLSGSSFYRLTDKPLFTPRAAEGYFYTRDWMKDLPENHPAVFYLNAKNDPATKAVYLEADDIPSSSAPTAFVTVTPLGRQNIFIYNRQEGGFSDFAEAMKNAMGKGPDGEINILRPSLLIDFTDIDLVEGGVIQGNVGAVGEGVHVQGVGDQLVVTLDPKGKDEQRFSFHLPKPKVVEAPAESAEPTAPAGGVARPSHTPAPVPPPRDPLDVAIEEFGKLGPPAELKFDVEGMSDKRGNIKVKNPIPISLKVFCSDKKVNSGSDLLRKRFSSGTQIGIKWGSKGKMIRYGVSKEGRDTLVLTPPDYAPQGIVKLTRQNLTIEPGSDIYQWFQRAVYGPELEISLREIPAFAGMTVAIVGRGDPEGELFDPVSEIWREHPATEVAPSFAEGEWGIRVPYQKGETAKIAKLVNRTADVYQKSLKPRKRVSLNVEIPEQARPAAAKPADEAAKAERPRRARKAVAETHTYNLELPLNKEIDSEFHPSIKFQMSITTQVGEDPVVRLTKVIVRSADYPVEDLEIFVGKNPVKDSPLNLPLVITKYPLVLTIIRKCKKSEGYERFVVRFDNDFRVSLVSERHIVPESKIVKGKIKAEDGEIHDDPFSIAITSEENPKTGVKNITAAALVLDKEAKAALGFPEDERGKLQTALPVKFEEGKELRFEYPGLGLEELVLKLAKKSKTDDTLVAVREPLAHDWEIVVDGKTHSLHGFLLDGKEITVPLKKIARAEGRERVEGNDRYIVDRDSIPKAIQWLNFVGDPISFDDEAHTDVEVIVRGKNGAAGEILVEKLVPFKENRDGSIPVRALYLSRSEFSLIQGAVRRPVVKGAASSEPVEIPDRIFSLESPDERMIPPGAVFLPTEKTLAWIRDLFYTNLSESTPFAEGAPLPQRLEFASAGGLVISIPVKWKTRPRNPFEINAGGKLRRDDGKLARDKNGRLIVDEGERVEIYIQGREKATRQPVDYSFRIHEEAGYWTLYVMTPQQGGRVKPFVLRTVISRHSPVLLGLFNSLNDLGRENSIKSLRKNASKLLSLHLDKFFKGKLAALPPLHIPRMKLEFREGKPIELTFASETEGEEESGVKVELSGLSLDEKLERIVFDPQLSLKVTRRAVDGEEQEEKIALEHTDGDSEGVVVLREIRDDDTKPREFVWSRHLETVSERRDGDAEDVDLDKLPSLLLDAGIPVSETPEEDEEEPSVDTDTARLTGNTFVTIPAEIPELAEKDQSFVFPPGEIVPLDDLEAISGLIGKIPLHDLVFLPDEVTAFSQSLIGRPDEMMTFVAPSGVILRIPMVARDKPPYHYLADEEADSVYGMKGASLLVPDPDRKGYFYEIQAAAWHEKRPTGHANNTIELQLLASENLNYTLEQFSVRKSYGSRPVFGFHLTQPGEEVKVPKANIHAALRTFVSYLNLHDAPQLYAKDVSELTASGSSVQLSDGRLLYLTVKDVGDNAFELEGIKLSEPKGDKEPIAYIEYEDEETRETGEVKKLHVFKAPDGSALFYLKDPETDDYLNMVLSSDGKLWIWERRAHIRELLFPPKSADYPMYRIDGDIYKGKACSVATRSRMSKPSDPVQKFEITTVMARWEGADEMSLVPDAEGGKARVKLVVSVEKNRELSVKPGTITEDEEKSRAYFPLRKRFDVRIVEDKWVNASGEVQRGRVRIVFYNENGRKEDGKTKITPYGWMEFRNRDALVGHSDRFWVEKAHFHFEKWRERNKLPDERGFLTKRAGAKVPEEIYFKEETFTNKDAEAGAEILGKLKQTEATEADLPVLLGAMEFLGLVSESGYYNETALTSLAFFAASLNDDVSKDDILYKAEPAEELELDPKTGLPKAWFEEEPTPFDEEEPVTPVVSVEPGVERAAPVLKDGAKEPPLGEWISRSEKSIPPELVEPISRAAELLHKGEFNEAIDILPGVIRSLNAGKKVGMASELQKLLIGMIVTRIGEFLDSVHDKTVPGYHVIEQQYQRLENRFQVSYKGLEKEARGLLATAQSLAEGTLYTPRVDDGMPRGREIVDKAPDYAKKTLETVYKLLTDKKKRGRELTKRQIEQKLECSLENVGYGLKGQKGYFLRVYIARLLNANLDIVEHDLRYFIYTHQSGPAGGSKRKAPKHVQGTGKLRREVGEPDEADKPEKEEGAGKDEAPGDIEDVGELDGIGGEDDVLEGLGKPDEFFGGRRDWLTPLGENTLVEHQVTRRQSRVTSHESRVGAQFIAPKRALGQVFARLFFAGRSDLRDVLREAELSAEQRRELTKAAKNGITLIATAERIVSELGSKSTGQQVNRSTGQTVRAVDAARTARPVVNPVLVK